ncbi:hypothetical protein [Pseudomonas sp. P108]|uniref:hypothetical protein n=1 Tax=Pseudomonas sp. P108 TaxID=1837993 RepID=UPI0029343FDB|nr:hypothetical protein [Pseudomonas sp. P108]WNZ87509.1 hypothetical protein QOM10_29945 [Pseudomonas sp. P108]
MINFSYCLDAEGNLVRISIGEHAKALIPGGVELITTAADLEYPLPWTKSVTDAVNEIRFVPYPQVIGTVAAAVHETRKLPESPFLFVPPATGEAPEQDVMDLIALYDDLPADAKGRGEIEAALAEVGIQQIPLLKRFVPEMYEGKVKSVPSAIVRQGWISHTKIYRKAQVR